MQRPWLELLDPRLTALKAAVGAGFDERLQLARALNGRARHGEAQEILEQLLAENRSHADAWFERLVCFSARADEEEGLELMAQLESLRDEHPGDGGHLRNLGYLRLLLQDADGAELALQQALGRDGQDPKALELLGLVQLHRGQSAEARAWLLKALSLKPKDPRTLRLMAIAMEQMDDWSGAEAQLMAALRVEEAYYWGWHALGELLLKRGDLPEGMRCIQRARTLQVCDPASYFILAEIFSEQGHLELAQGQLHALMLLAPPASVLAEAQALLGELKRDMGDRDGAASYFSLATETDPEASNPWAALGEMAREDGRWDDALRCYREALVREPGAADLQVQLGYALLETRQGEAAEQAFLQALELDPGEYSAYLGLSEVCRFSNRREDQLRMVEEAMTLAPDDADVWNARGVALEVTDRWKEATEAYEKALALESQHRKAANNLGFVLEKRMNQGEPDLRPRAVEAWRQRLLICHEGGQSLKMAKEHLVGLGVEEATLREWLRPEFLTADTKA
ncbi:tetratricopeptide repeat protein [Geothrix sp. 21YS21S-4]|uniref:tetratricopeptide repeat protein n=1 Tax=Geothrix sp. 21YS21S-4 TaxID=3068889 RepID=UPI0027B95EA7|nr:tetratricopeptide repeat protein [Geothrix sp. 21YS21S-4]